MAWYLRPTHAHLVGASRYSKEDEMKYLIQLGIFVFLLALMYLIWDKYPAPLSEKIFFEAAIGLVGLGGLILLSLELDDF